MPIHRLTCPGCGAGLKSAAGFKPGATVSCPKCSAEFEAEEPEVEAEVEEEEEKPRKKKKKKKAEKEWSYRNSWIRYAILGVLVAVMCVLGYMLYLKNEREKRADAGSVAAARPV
ncbi:unnamed protein product [Gemmataceae bacterium]|nr:unnamed protein product [Gemmataceae bacterium]VTT97047.1 unnamed protein product [Gemmataceae bacterium]